MAPAVSTILGTVGIIGGIGGGAITGLATGLVSGAFSGGFMALLPGGNGNFLKGALQGAISGAVGGAIIGGAVGGLTTPKGHNIWTGAAKRPVVTPISELKSAGIVNTADDGLSLQAEGMPARATGTGAPIDNSRPVVRGIDGRAGGDLNLQATEGVSATKIPSNRLNHIFGKPEHVLDDFVKQFGTQNKAYDAVQNAANHALNSGTLAPNAHGILPSGNAGNIISVRGTNIRLIGGRVVDGRVILSSFSRKGL